jgi:hypothetical protein
MNAPASPKNMQLDLTLAQGNFNLKGMKGIYG